MSSPNEQTTQPTRRTRSGRVIRQITRYEPNPDTILEDDSSCDDFSLSDDEISVLSGSHLNDESEVDEEYSCTSSSESESEDEEEPTDSTDEYETDIDDDVDEDDILDWDRLTENASELESSDDEEF